MRIVIFGATGMVGQGVLLACLADEGVTEVLTVGRSATGREHAKLREITHSDMTNFGAIADRLVGFDACFFCLGVTSAGMSEDDYRRVTYDIAVAAARTLVAKSPAMTFIFVSGAGTDATEKGRTMWARVKGATENAILGMPFAASYAFRPAFIHPEDGITSRTRSYRLLYAVGRPLYPLLKALMPALVTTTSKVGRAMLNVARSGYPKRVLMTEDINLAASGEAPSA